MIMNLNNLYKIIRQIVILRYLNKISKLYKNQIVNILNILLYNYKDNLFIKIN
jgi:hypothetical protein